MRVTCDRRDPAYAPEHRRAIVFLDGKRVERCITADDKEGMVIVHPVDDAGRLLVDREKQELVRQELRGRVRIVIPERI